MGRDWSASFLYTMYTSWRHRPRPPSKKNYFFSPRGRRAFVYTAYNFELGVDLRESLKMCDVGDIFCPANITKGHDQITRRHQDAIAVKQRNELRQQFRADVAVDRHAFDFGGEGQRDLTRGQSRMFRHCRAGSRAYIRHALSPIDEPPREGACPLTVSDGMPWLSSYCASQHEKAAA